MCKKSRQHFDYFAPLCYTLSKSRRQIAMRLFIGSDIHGSSANVARFLDIVQRARQEDDTTKVVLLGDIYNHGPRNPFPEGYAPMKVAEMLNGAKDYITVIKGNCDSEVDQMISEFPINSDFTMDWQGRTVYFTHGHKCNPDLPPKDAKKGDIVFYGHFHRAMLEEKDGVIYVCVGAIGLSPEGVERSYAILSEHSITVKTLEGDKTIIQMYI